MEATRRDFLRAGSLAVASAWMPARQDPPPKPCLVCVIGHTGGGDYGHDLDLAFRTIPRAKVLAVADPDEKGRLQAVRRSGAARGYADFREMLKREKPDLVAVCPRWVGDRLELVTAAAEAGAHVCG